MSIHGETLFTKCFTNKVSKEAYLQACKWLAKNVYSKPDISKYITVKIEKVKNKKQESTFKISLFVVIDENEVFESYCKKCKHLHTLLYSVDKPKCDECKLKAYKRNLSGQIENLFDFCKEAIVEDEEC